MNGIKENILNNIENRFQSNSSKINHEKNKIKLKIQDLEKEIFDLKKCLDVCENNCFGRNFYIINKKISFINNKKIELFKFIDDVDKYLNNEKMKLEKEKDSNISFVDNSKVKKFISFYRNFIKIKTRNKFWDNQNDQVQKVNKSINELMVSVNALSSYIKDTKSHVLFNIKVTNAKKNLKNKIAHYKKIEKELRGSINSAKNNLAIKKFNNTLELIEKVKLKQKELVHLELVKIESLEEFDIFEKLIENTNNDMQSLIKNIMIQIKSMEFLQALEGFGKQKTQENRNILINIINELISNKNYSNYIVAYLFRDESIRNLVIYFLPDLGEKNVLEIPGDVLINFDTQREVENQIVTNPYHWGRWKDFEKIMAVAKVCDERMQLRLEKVKAPLQEYIQTEGTFIQGVYQEQEVLQKWKRLRLISENEYQILSIKQGKEGEKGNFEKIKAFEKIFEGIERSGYGKILVNGKVASQLFLILNHPKKMEPYFEALREEAKRYHKKLKVIKKVEKRIAKHSNQAELMKELQVYQGCAIAYIQRGPRYRILLEEIQRKISKENLPSQMIEPFLKLVETTHSYILPHLIKLNS